MEMNSVQSPFAHYHIQYIYLHVQKHTHIVLHANMHAHNGCTNTIPIYIRKNHSIGAYICTHQYCCLHLLSLQNGLTALEVARASTDKVLHDEDELYWDDEYSELRQRAVVRDYDGVVDLLSGYTAEPAVLPSHPVSGTTSSH